MGKCYCIKRDEYLKKGELRDGVTVNYCTYSFPEQIFNMEEKCLFTENIVEIKKAGGFAYLSVYRCGLHQFEKANTRNNKPIKSKFSTIDDLTDWDYNI